MSDRPCDPRPIRLETVEGTTHLHILNPILSTDVLHGLDSSLRSLRLEALRPLVLRSDHPSVFLAGADLGEIAGLDGVRCIAYAEHGRALVHMLETFPSATVAVVHGSCSGGGFDIVMACDLIVAGGGASFEHPGVRRGLVTGWSGSVTIPAAIGPSISRAAFIEGRRISGSEAEVLGVVDRTSAHPVAEATELAMELGHLDPERRRLWRLLRGHRFVDRFRASVVHKL